MLNLIEVNVNNYKPEEEGTTPTNERLAKFYQFLEKQDYQKFFVWVDFEKPTLESDFYMAPLFYEAGKVNFFFFLAYFDTFPFIRILIQFLLK